MQAIKLVQSQSVNDETKDDTGLNSRNLDSASAQAHLNTTLGESWGEFVGRRAPNALTFLRFLLVPVFIFTMTLEERHLWSTAVFVIASFTDWLDGYLARRYNAHSTLGTLMDPLADKILVMAALILLAALPGPERIPAWIVIALLSREMIINGLRSLAALNHTVVPASKIAKHKTGWTMAAIVLLLVGNPFQVIDFHLLGMIALWVALAISIFSAIQYAYSLRRFYL